MREDERKASHRRSKVENQENRERVHDCRVCEKYCRTRPSHSGSIVSKEERGELRSCIIDDA